MNPAALAKLAIVLIDALELLIPKIQEAFKKGEISAEEQFQLQERIDKLRLGGQSFVGDEWEQGR